MCQLLGLNANTPTVERAHPFATAQLQDADVTVDFSQHTTPEDRVAVVVTQPLTSNETWRALASGELAAFADGRRVL